MNNNPILHKSTAESLEQAISEIEQGQDDAAKLRAYLRDPYEIKLLDNVIGQLYEARFWLESQ